MKKNTRSFLCLMLALVLSLTLLAGCKKEAEEESSVILIPEKTVEDISVPEPVESSVPEVAESSKAEESSQPEESAPAVVKNPYVNPLTGETEDHEVSGKRPVAFMINNIWVAVPQWGVKDADIILIKVYVGEYILDHGIDDVARLEIVIDTR